MIERNLGKIERTVRLIGAVILTAWAAGRDSHDLFTFIALFIAAALLLNFFFSRCYLWALLGLNSCSGNERDSSPPRRH